MARSARLKPWRTMGIKQGLLYVVLPLSLVGNVILISSFVLASESPLVLLNTAIPKLCSEPMYSQLLRGAASNSSNPERAKKFVAASVCFTDYQTGKPLNLDSMTPLPSAVPALPPHP